MYSVPPGFSSLAKAERLLEVSVAKDRAEKAQAEVSAIAGLCYDLFRKLLKEEPQTQGIVEIVSTGLEDGNESSTSRYAIRLLLVITLPLRIFVTLKVTSDNQSQQLN